MSYVPLQLEAHAAHIARQARMRANAVEDSGKPICTKRDRLCAIAEAWRTKEAERAAREAQAVRNAEERSRHARDMRDLIKTTRIDGHPTIGSIQATVAQAFDINIDDIMSSRRTTAVVVPRMVAMFFCREMTPHGLPTIGRLFKRDHTTILNAVERIGVLSGQDPKFRAKIESIRTELRTTMKSEAS
jgi:chromosomal replication initiation ATPase DnaA